MEVLYTFSNRKQARGQTTSSQKDVDRLREARIKNGCPGPVSSWQPQCEPVLLLRMLCMLCPWAGSRVRLSAKHSELRGVTFVEVE